MSNHRFIALVLFLILSSTNVLAGRGRSIEVELRDRYSRKPIPNAQVICEKTEDTLYTDAAGICVFEECRGKKFTFIIKHPDFKESLELVKFKNRKGDEVRFSLMPNAGSLTAYIKEVGEKETEKRRQIDSTMYLPCDQDSTPEVLMAQFPGGINVMSAYIANSLEYPEEAIDMEEQGKVYVSFIIQKDGRITDISIERGISESLDKEVIRLIGDMPNWIPQYCNGRPQVVKSMLPIVFTLH